MTKKILPIFILFFSSCSQVAQNANYPSAEWNPAATILMHTPGEELFDGIIHPSAGLFEYYFDIDAAAREHQAYISLLENEGIEVYTVIELLQSVDIEKLRTLASQSLIYDSSNLNESPDSVEAYRQSVLAQMTRNDMIRCITMQPTVVLSSTGDNTGYEAIYTHEPMMNLYFTRDQSITTPKGHIICNMNSTQRAIETDVIELCYESMGKESIYRMKGSAHLEGGDYIPAGTLSYLGIGMRTNQEAVDSLLSRDLIGHDTLVICKDAKFWQLQMHLDTYFNVIDEDLVTMVESRYTASPGDPEYVTVDMYSRAPGEREYSLSESGIGFVDFLRNRGIEIIPIQECDELHYANNYLTIAPREIVAVGGQSEKFEQDMENHGVKVHWLDLENLICGYCAAHCMTQVLSRIN